MAPRFCRDVCFVTTKEGAIRLLQCFKPLVIAVSFLIFFNAEAAICIPDVCKNLDRIPKEEREGIVYLFQRLMYETPMAYTLFGDKPLTIELFPLSPNLWWVVECSHQAGMLTNIKVWKKYADLFPSHNFVLKDKVEDNRLEITLINRSACSKVISENLDLFQSIIGEKLTTEQLLDKICESRDIYKEVIHSNFVLEGLLYGFGRNNSLAFHDKYSKKLPIKNLDFYDKETNALILFRTLGFVTVPNDRETETLRKNYNERRNYLLEIYKQGDFLELTLAQYMGMLDKDKSGL